MNIVVANQDVIKNDISLTNKRAIGRDPESVICKEQYKIAEMQINVNITKMSSSSPWAANTA